MNKLAAVVQTIANLSLRVTLTEFLSFACSCTSLFREGKSTYLKQIAIITILSHCGSYVPAEFATIPVRCSHWYGLYIYIYIIAENDGHLHIRYVFQIRDRLCTRIGNTDDQGTAACILYCLSIFSTKLTQKMACLQKTTFQPSCEYHAC